MEIRLLPWKKNCFNFTADVFVSCWIKGGIASISPGWPLKEGEAVA